MDVYTLPFLIVVVNGIISNNYSTITTTCRVGNMTSIDRFMNTSTILELCNTTVVTVVLDGYPLYVVRGRGCLRIYKLSNQYYIVNNTVYFVRIRYFMYSSSRDSEEIQRFTITSKEITRITLNPRKYLAVALTLLEVLRRLRALNFEEF